MGKRLVSIDVTVKYGMEYVAHIVEKKCHLWSLISIRWKLL